MGTMLFRKITGAAERIEDVMERHRRKELMARARWSGRSLKFHNVRIHLTSQGSRNHGEIKSGRPNAQGSFHGPEIRYFYTIWRKNDDRTNGPTLWQTTKTDGNKNAR